MHAETELDMEVSLGCCSQEPSALPLRWGLSLNLEFSDSARLAAWGAQGFVCLYSLVTWILFTWLHVNARD